MDLDRLNNKLCRLVKENNLAAENELLMANEGLIVNLAGSMEVAYDLDINHWGGIYKEDIMQEGRIALLRAAQTYDECNNAKFSTYAYTIVRNAMTDLCRKGISSYENRMIEAGYTQEFFDDYYAKDEDGLHISETVGSKEFDPTARQAVLRVMIQKMKNRLKVLPPRLQRLLAYRYGFGMAECKSISEAAAFFHLTEKYLKAIEKNALAELRDGMNDGKII